MKFNLKDRPKAKYPHNSVTEKWFRGFEAELRRMLEGNLKLGFTPDYLTLHRVVKEILGE